MPGPIFLQGADVSYVGVAMPPARGKLLSFASESAAYVRWATGARSGQIVLYDLRDLEPTDQLPDYLAVKHAMAIEGETGVINHLASARELVTWTDIATRVLRFTAEQLRHDASMETPGEQLDPEQFERVLAVASRVLLRDAFSEAS